VGVSYWNEPLNRENLAEFFNQYAPAAYKSVYRMLGDTTRTENVLLDTFVELFHERNSADMEDPVMVLGLILQKRASQMAAKYPLPDNYRFSVRSLDEFTQTTLLSDINRKIDSLSFRILDMITATTTQHLPGGGGVTRIAGEIADSGISLLLIAELLIVGLLIAGVTYFGAMRTFGVSDAIPNYRITAEQNADEKLVAALSYLPLELHSNNVYSDRLPEIPDPGQEEDPSDAGEGTTTTGETTADISATMG
jgi:hypothetical protein